MTPDERTALMVALSGSLPVVALWGDPVTYYTVFPAILVLWACEFPMWVRTHWRHHPWRR